MLSKIKARAGVTALTTSALVLGVVSPSFAAAYDFTPAVDGVTAQITGVLTTALPIAGGLIALAVGWKLIRKMVKGA
jgi:mannose/fructose/N-acetylgalactosamine-specific phosphotransferase system component IIC